ncbi:hypothetical protein GALL_207720 [mine drainage metagenome]|uniref:Uncharacterized protein n=1 Tax=mine drainage metagenome TaxID=410659 RepID=A0A1J5RNS3_9ZZZZ
MRGGGGGRDLAGTPNVPRALAAVISARLATLAELETRLGAEDLYDLLEILAVDAHNRARLRALQE